MQYFEQFNFIDLCEVKWLEIELLDNLNFVDAQLGGAAEYTDCISAEGKDTPQWVS